MKATSRNSRVAVVVGIATLALSFGSVGLTHASIVDAGQFPGNDCGGTGGFAACRADTDGTNQGGSGSPVIYKRDKDGAEDFGMYPSITGDEFLLTFNPTTLALHWEYTPNDPEDPEIHFFDIKQADTYHLFYDLVNPIPEATIFLSDIGYNDFSHVTWFDTGGVPPQEIPEPTTWALLAAGLVGLGVVRRRQR